MIASDVQGSLLPVFYYFPLVTKKVLADCILFYLMGFLV